MDIVVLAPSADLVVSQVVIAAGMKGIVKI